MEKIGKEKITEKIRKQDKKILRIGKRGREGKKSRRKKITEQRISFTSYIIFGSPKM